jgi:hypothetical protein
MRLLRAGKSWVDGKDNAVRYRLSNGRAMPKFGSAKNPFRSTAKATLDPAETQGGAHGVLALPQSGTPTAPATAQDTDFGARTAPVRRNPESKLTPALLPERSRHSVAARAGTVRAPKGSTSGILWGALSKVAWLVFRPRPNRAAPPLPDFDKSPVQGELSLEKIKPVRNDLSDADLDIILAKPPAPTPTPLPLKRGEGEVVQPRNLSVPMRETVTDRRI